MSSKDSPAERTAREIREMHLKKLWDVAQQCATNPSLNPYEVGYDAFHEAERAIREALVEAANPLPVYDRLHRYVVRDNKTGELNIHRTGHGARSVRPCRRHAGRTRASTMNAHPLPKEQSDAVVGELRKAIAAAINNARRVK